MNSELGFENADLEPTATTHWCASAVLDDMLQNASDSKRIQGSTAAAISFQLSDIFEQVASQLRQQSAAGEGSMPRETVPLETAPKPRVSVTNEVFDALAAARKGDLATVWKVAKGLNDRSKSDGSQPFEDFRAKFCDTLRLAKTDSDQLWFYFEPGQDVFDWRNEVDVPAGMRLVFPDDLEGRSPPDRIKIEVDDKGKVLSAQSKSGNGFGPESWSDIDKTKAIEKMINRFRYNERQRRLEP